MKIRLRKDQAAQIGVEGISEVVNPGDVIEVNDDVAGHPPSGTEGTKSHDLGSGLLAQSEKWEPAPKSATADIKSED